MIDQFDIDRLEGHNRIRARYRSIRHNQDIIDDDDCRITETEKNQCRATIQVLRDEIAAIAKKFQLV
jgi:hypothetical protein